MATLEKVNNGSFQYFTKVKTDIILILKEVQCFSSASCPYEKLFSFNKYFSHFTNIFLRVREPIALHNIYN